MNAEPWKDEQDEPPTEYGLVLPFIDQSETFCLGFEAGTQYARMQYGVEQDFVQTVHTENVGQIRAAAQAAGWSARFEPLTEDWTTMYAERGATA